MEAPHAKTYACPVEVTLDLIGGKWKPLVLWHLKVHGVLRHGELRRLIPSVSQKVLTQQLRQLEADGLVLREVFAEVPPRVEYSMTARGRELEALLDQFCAWGERQADRLGWVIEVPPGCTRDGAAM